MIKFLTLFILFFISTNIAFSATLTASQTGNWNNANTWDGINIPTSSDDVNIPNGITITIPSSYTAQAKTITLNSNSSSATNNYISFTDNTSSINTVGDFTMQIPSSATGDFSGILNLSSGTLIIGGNLSLPIKKNGGNIYLNELYVSSGYLEVAGNITISRQNPGQSFIDLSNSNGTLQIGGSFNITNTDAITPQPVAGKIIYAGTAEQTIETDIQYAELEINNSTGVVFNGTITTNGDVTINTGYVNSNNSNITNNTSSTFTLSGSTIYYVDNSFPTGFTTYTLSNTSTVNYQGGNQNIQTIGTPGYGYLILSSSGNKTANGNIYVQRNFTISGSANYRASTYTTYISGNFTNNNSFTSQSSTISFEGPADKIISGNTTSFYNLTISGVGNVTLSTPINVTGTLSMNYGILYSTSTNKITLKSSSTASIGNANSYIDGPLFYEVTSTSPLTLSFPVGKESNWNPFELSITHSTTTSYTYKAEVINSSAEALNWTLPGTISHASDIRYWTINRFASSDLNTQVPNTNLTTAQVTLYYNSTDGVTDETNLRIIKGTSTSSTWTDIGGTGTSSGSGSITSSAFNSFSTFALGNASGGANPLPIELSEFTALKTLDGITFAWVTYSENNNDFFSLEYSTYGVDFQNITNIKGNGTKSNETDYEYFDNTVYSGKVVYFRLKQTDFSGIYTYSNVLTVSNDNFSNNIYIFPNPASDFVTIQDSYGSIQNIQFTTTNNTLISPPFTGETFDISSFPSGIYFIKIKTDSNIFTHKLIVK